MFRSQQMKKKALRLMRDNIQKAGVDVTTLALDNPNKSIEYIHGQLKIAKEQIKTQCKS